MMAQPRASKKYTTLFPSSLHYHQSSDLIHPGVRGLTGSPSLFGLLSPKLLMGRGIAAQAIKSALKDLKITKPLIVTGASGVRRQHELFMNAFDVPSIDALKLPCYGVNGEPTTDDALKAVALAKQNNCDGVLSVGGGSSIDLGKAVAALATNENDIFEHMEVVGRGKAIENTPLPFIAVPTTSGTGSEVTKNAVLKSVQHGMKASIRHDTMLPKVAIIDPTLTISCPPDVTAHVGLDTLCQVIEPYVSYAANPFTDALARDGILRASRSLRAVVADGANVEAREDLSIACVFGGMALANAKLGAVHGYAAVLGGMFDHAPHGAICASLLPAVFKANVMKLQALAESGDADAMRKLERFVDVSRIITGCPHASAEDGADWLEALVKDLRVPRIGALCEGIKKEQIPEIARLTATASSTKGNPVPLTPDELEDILTKAF